jgi:hypothetical protein
MPEIPDFTKAPWQSRRRDAQLLASTLEGKDEMPAWRGKVSQEQARGLVAHVRAFAPTPTTPKANSDDGFAARFRQLQEQMRELQRQERELSKDSPHVAPSEPSQSPQPGASRPPATTPAGGPVVSDLFR